MIKDIKLPVILATIVLVFSIIINNFLPLLVIIINIGLIMVVKRIRPKRIWDIIFLLFSILSVITYSFWYLSIILGTISLIYSIKRIIDSGSFISKLATFFSIVGLAICSNTYISSIMEIIVWT